MLKHRYILSLFLLLLFLPFGVDFFSNPPAFYFIFISLLFFAIEFYGAYFIHSNFHLKAICSAPSHENTLALSFDDGPAEETSAILDVLKEFDVKATFFCIGKHIAGRESVLERIIKEGHILGNHSYSHGFFFDLQTTKAIRTDLEKASQLIQHHSGKTPLFFRPPYGVTTPALARAVKQLNYTVIGWNIRSLDTSIKNKKALLQRIQKRLKPGSILLLHDTIAGNALLLRELLVLLQEKKYKVIPLPTLIQQAAYA